jgi:hypothetical protein
LSNQDNKVKATEMYYEYFVKSYQKNDDSENVKQINFNDIISNVKSLMNEKNLNELHNCFKVSNEWKNYRVTVTSYDLAKELNEIKMFLPYRKQRYINVRTRLYRGEKNQQEQ